MELSFVIIIIVVVVLATALPLLVILPLTLNKKKLNSHYEAINNLRQKYENNEITQEEYRNKLFELNMDYNK